MAKYKQKTVGSMEQAVAAPLKRKLYLKRPSSQYGVHAQLFNDTVTKM